MALAGRAASKGSFLGVNTATFLIAAAIFGAIAVGMWRLSRAASVEGLVLFLPNAIWWLLYDHRLIDTARTLLMTVVFGVLFVNGVRGTFAYHRFIVEEPGADAPRLSKNEKKHAM